MIRRGLCAIAAIGLAGMTTNAWSAQPDAPGISPAIRAVPGDGIVDGRRIPAYENIWRFYVVTPGGEEIDQGIWHDRVTILEREGREILYREQRIDAAQGPDSLHIDEMDRQSLAPLHVSIRYGDAEPAVDIRFEGNRLRGRRPVLADGASEPIPVELDVALAEPVFDWHLWGLLIAGFPLEDNYSASFLAHGFIPGSPSLFTDVRFVVSGSETLDAGARGMVDCWIVDVQAVFPWRIWIAKDRSVAPVVQIRIDSPDGLERWWKPRDAD